MPGYDNNKRRLIEMACHGDTRIYRVRIAGRTYGLSRADLHYYASEFNGQCRRHLRRIRRYL